VPITHATFETLREVSLSYG